MKGEKVYMNFNGNKCQYRKYFWIVKCNDFLIICDFNGYSGIVLFYYCFFFGYKVLLF